MSELYQSPWVRNVDSILIEFRILYNMNQLWRGNGDIFGTIYNISAFKQGDGGGGGTSVFCFKNKHLVYHYYYYYQL